MIPVSPGTLFIGFMGMVGYLRDDNPGSHNIKEDASPLSWKCTQKQFGSNGFDGCQLVVNMTPRSWSINTAGGVFVHAAFIFMPGQFVERP
ncbi:MAG: hypothetical protein JXR32_08090 [Anaerolineaceae bacterium]|nr:hypothetical protein [Anaerolineaceae bacterium]